MGELTQARRKRPTPNAQRPMSNAEKARREAALNSGLDVGRWAFDVFFVLSDSSSALLIVGHGSTLNPASSSPTLMHAETIRSRGIFADVACCFWKEEPSLRDALFFFRDPAIREV